MLHVVVTYIQNHQLISELNFSAIIFNVHKNKIEIILGGK